MEGCLPPSHHILAGNKLTNFRKVVTARLGEQGLRGREIREREIRSRPCDPEQLRLTSAQGALGALLRRQDRDL